MSKLYFPMISIFILFQVIPVSAEEKDRGAEIIQKANSGNCQSYVGYALGNEMLQRLHDYAKLFYIEDVIFTISGGDSMLKLRREGYREIIANEIDVLLKSGDDLSLDELPDAYVDGFYSGSLAVKAGEFLNGKNAPKGSKEYVVCMANSAMFGKEPYSDEYKNVIAFASKMKRTARIEHFEISSSRCHESDTVGTNNQYAEPEQWDGSRFYIVDASFKNLDTESRLPAEGDLIIKSNGIEYTFDGTENVMLKGYGIYFKSINPLLTMKTKIVYRIPNEVSGPVFWRPGRNSEGVKLWCGNLSAHLENKK